MGVLSRIQVRRNGATYEKWASWRFTRDESWETMASNIRFAGRGHFLLCTVVLVAPVVVRVSC